MSVRSKPQTIHIASKEQLICKECALHLWQNVRFLTHLSGAGLIDAMEGFFRDLDILGIEISYSSGEQWPIPYIFELFPEVNKKGQKTEGGRRWVNGYKSVFTGGVRPTAKPEIWDRMICMELFVHATVAKYTRGSDTPRCSMTHVPLGW